MAFQVSYGEHTVLITALSIAIREFESRAADARMSVFREESAMQARIARDMYVRLNGAPMWDEVPSEEKRVAGVRALEDRLGRALGL